MKIKFLPEFFSRWYRHFIRHPKYRWWIIAGTLAYLVGPIDILPDIFPIIGWIDDGAVATLLAAEISQLIIERFKAGKKDSLASNSSNLTTQKSLKEINHLSLAK